MKNMKARRRPTFYFAAQQTYRRERLYSWRRPEGSERILPVNKKWTFAIRETSCAATWQESAQPATPEIGKKSRLTPAIAERKCQRNRQVTQATPALWTSPRSMKRLLFRCPTNLSRMIYSSDALPVDRNSISRRNLPRANPSRE